MKKWIICIMAIMSFVSCSKDNNVDYDSGYNTEVKEVLNVLHGKWQQEGGVSNEILSFEPFGQQKAINGSAGGVMYFYGNATRQFYYVDSQSEVWKMYFYVNTKKQEISMNGIDDDGKYSIVRTKTYDYKIINHNTIQLHDKSLSSLNIYNYNRIR